MSSQEKNYLNQLEDEAIYILRETAAQFERPALLFSGGKDSIVLIHLALKAFRPGKFPFPLVHVDTGHNFPEAIKFRDYLVDKIGEKLIVASVENAIKKYNLKETSGRFPSRNALQTYALLDVIEENEFDACIGGARRDEEKARAKERIFSVRDDFGQWDPKLQRPELWNILNGRIEKGHNVRVFPISNWTELDVWNYIKQNNIELPNLYFAHERECIVYNDKLIATSDFIQPNADDEVVVEKVRYRTVGDMTCTAAVPSDSSTIEDIIIDIINTRISERGQTRLDDQLSESAMEERKKQGYF
ncbi:MULTISPECIES: sulfate adenylyltransferase subunit CysD [Empedobacter]|uniref:sulfate adenylyltransferase subunit CysD n=1 Tax=Empedobacter TaxID=59734 RepID=UPI001C58C82A|nr:MULTISPECIES: sulfate adenylyltransferase subunit CysD [Empedobacter]MBW1619352.1 sulfate adenylyltransferase subunit 2 [Empedobacter falsenii]MDM1139750.1 sulfate adenylyltransferase subunit 2 [Empedobacter sp. R132-2]